MADTDGHVTPLILTPCNHPLLCVAVINAVRDTGDVNATVFNHIFHELVVSSIGTHDADCSSNREPLLDHSLTAIKTVISLNCCLRKIHWVIKD